MKIKIAQLKELNQDVKTFVLTFNSSQIYYDHLNQDLENKYLKDHAGTDLKVQHFTDFLKEFLEADIAQKRPTKISIGWF